MQVYFRLPNGQIIDHGAWKAGALPEKVEVPLMITTGGTTRFTYDPPAYTFRIVQRHDDFVVYG